MWRESLGGPLLLIGGGSGIVPLRAMLRHHVAIGSTVPVRMLYSARSMEDVIYREELGRLAERDLIDVHFTLTRERPVGWTGYRRRIDPEMLGEATKLGVAGVLMKPVQKARLLEMVHRAVATLQRTQK